MFPDPQHPPARATQRPRHQSIASPICRQLPLPERPIVLRLRRVLGTAMPETAVHEHCELEFGKDEIRLSKERLIAPPTGDVVQSKKFRQRQFRILVPTPANPGHDLRSLRLGEDVRHLLDH